MGINENYFDIQLFTSNRRCALSKQDNDSHINTAVIYDKLANSLFGRTKTVGQMIDVNFSNQHYISKIIGVYRYEASAMGDAFQVASKNAAISFYLPLSTAKQLSGSPAGTTSLTIKTKSSVNSERFSRKTVHYLNQHYYQLQRSISYRRLQYGNHAFDHEYHN